MYYINKLVWVLVNPISVALLAFVAGAVLAALSRRRSAVACLGCGAVWLWLWSTPMMYRWVGCSLEDEWRYVAPDDQPVVDAIVVLGGGVTGCTNAWPSADMSCGADRVRYAAKLWKAGAARFVIATGTGERTATLPLLMDFGVARDAIIIEEEARNTEENAALVSALLAEREKEFWPPSQYQADRRRSILLVTSAWHMRRSLAMFSKYAPELDVVPAPTDFEATVKTGEGFTLKDLLPDASALMCNAACIKEIVGYWGYRLLRR